MSARRRPTCPTRSAPERLREGALRYASLAVTLGASREEAREALDEAWRGLAPFGPGEALAGEEP